MRGWDRSCHRHLGCDSSLALELGLVLLERLLPAASQILAVVMFWHAVLKNKGRLVASSALVLNRTYCAAEFCPTVRALADDTECRLVAAGLRLELATLLGRHDVSCAVKAAVKKGEGELTFADTEVRSCALTVCGEWEG